MHFIATVLMVANGYRAGLKQDGQPDPKIDPPDEIWKPYKKLRDNLEAHRPEALQYMKEIEKNLRLLAADNELRKTKLTTPSQDSDYADSARELLSAIETYGAENSWRKIIDGY